jgi:hypothetical protein
LSLICLSVGIARDTLSVPLETNRKSRTSNGYKITRKFGSLRCESRDRAGGFLADLPAKIGSSFLVPMFDPNSAIWQTITNKHRKFLRNGMLHFQMSHRLKV